MYTIRVEDFIDVKESKSSFDVNDMIHICKRHNNPKREYLFVNKYQGKHYPANPKDVLRVFDELFYEIEKKYISTDKKILVVGFAETATGIAQRITHNAITQGTINVVYHLQTTRENIETDIRNINFDEQHSHAVSQKLYYPENVPDYDVVLFIEVEITTGNTFINFIIQFKKLNPKAKYAVASILNWQNKENEEKYKELDIDTIYLVKGYIKNELPELDIEQKYILVHEPTVENVKILSDQQNPRTGLSVEDFKEFVATNNHFYKLAEQYKDEKVMVIGTEENMYLPILVANYLGNQTTVRATTRSPIAVCEDEGYLIYNGIEMPSAYESNRVTYLYDIDNSYDTALVIVETATVEFKKHIEQELKNKGIKHVVFLQ